MIEINQSLIIQIVNLIIFLFILNHLVFKPIVRVLGERHERIEGTMEKAQVMEAEIQEKLEEYERRIQEARNLATNEKESLRRHGENVAKEIVEKARIELARDIPIIRSQIVSESDRVRRDLEKMARKMASDIAGRVLGRKIS